MRECTWVVFLLTAAAAIGQVAGPSVNMVTGTSWPDGDPFLQRQNEPSMAVSSRNVLHLLAGANDYRTVDLPGIDVNEPTGDAWLGVFKKMSRVPFRSTAKSLSWCMGRQSRLARAPRTTVVAVTV